MRNISLLLSLVFLVACATPEQRGAYIADHIERNFGPTCAAMGYEPGTDKYRDCKLSLFNADTQRAGSAAAAQIKK
jgi:hypothetical protein